MVENIDPIVPEGTPLPTPPVGVPPYPITPFAVWTWDSPVIPSFYWNIYSAEQRIKMICKEIGKIEAYLNYLVNKTNENIIDLQKQITVLDTRLTALEKKLAEEVARLDALIAKLREDLTAETKARQDGDKALDSRITTESNKLHTEISTEKQDRIHADDSLHTEISTEAQARQDADSALEAKLTGEIAKRLLPTEVTAGDEISITQPDPNSNRVVIASTVAHSISGLETEVSGVKAALEAEVSERRAEDSKLWQAVNQRIERGKILAGSGIKVVNDPDSTTVTISTTGSGTGGVTPIKGVAPVLVVPNEEGYTIGAEAATEMTAGVITEARVKELAPKATTTTVTGTAPVTVSGSPESGYTIGATAATTSTPGVITESRVKELAPGTTVAGTSPITVSGSPEGGYTVGVNAATASTPGVVKIGSGITVASDGTISAAAGGDSNHAGAGLYSVSIGEGAETNSTSKGGTAVGFNATTLDSWTTVVGYKAHSDGYQSVALGSNATAYRSFSTIIGDDSESQGEYGTALGQGASANGKAAVAIGSGSEAGVENTVSFGAGENASSGKPATRRLVNVTDPADAQDAATKAYVDAIIAKLKSDNGLK